MASFGTLKKDWEVSASHFFAAGIRDILAKQSNNMQAGTYTFDELSDHLKEEAIEANRDINTYYDWHEFVIEGFQEDLDDMGVGDVEVEYSGFYSQGDGASFTGKVEDMKLFLTKTLGMTQYSNEELDELPVAVKEKANGFIDSLTIAFNRKYGSRYSHEETCQADTWCEILNNAFYDEEYPDGKIRFTDRVLTGDPIVFMDLDHEVSKIDEAAEEWRSEQCRELYRSLENEYDYLQSDEAVAETLESNGTEFEVDEDGELVT
jgi:hypothetical protein